MAARKKKTQSRLIVIISAVLCIVTGIVLLATGLVARSCREKSGVPVQAQPDEFEESYIDMPHRMYGDLADIHIKLIFDDQAEILTIDEIAPWLNVAQKGHQYFWTIKGDEVRTYADMLDQKYSNFRSSVSFVSHTGETITVENKSTGWIFNPEYAAGKLIEYIQNSQSAELDLTDRSKESNQWWIRVSGSYHALKKSGECFAEVSIDDQYMWVVKNGKVIMESPVVTGNPNYGNDTPTGAYYVYEKKSPCTLYGPGYETEVSYWMAFIDDIGFHDAVWQDYFGGDVYYTNGSHGCVNIPLYFAEELYRTVYVYMPVYVY